MGWTLNRAEGRSARTRSSRRAGASLILFLAFMSLGACQEGAGVAGGSGGNETGDGGAESAAGGSKDTGGSGGRKSDSGGAKGSGGAGEPTTGGTKGVDEVEGVWDEGRFDESVFGD